MTIMNEPQLARVNIPEGTDFKDPLALFSLFCPDSIIQQIATNTNTYAQMHRPPVPLRSRPWFNTNINELKVFIGILIYMGVHREANVPSYWNNNLNEGPIHTVRLYMSLTRFQQLKRYLRVAPCDVNRPAPNRRRDVMEDLRGPIDNCVKMQSILYEQHELPRPGYLQFRQDLYRRLFDSYKTIIETSRKRKLAPEFPPCRLNRAYQHQPCADRPMKVLYTCVWCRHSAKRSRNNSGGSNNRAKQTRWWCGDCRKPLCRPDTGRSCWEEFHTTTEDDIMAIFA
jgi:hypothetical protein